MHISRLLIFSSVVMAACTNDPVTPTPREPAAIELVTTLPTEVQIGTPITVEVRVVDAGGLPVPGVSVTFGQGIGTGVFTPAEVNTGANGVATTTWQITASAGSAFASAQAGSVMTHFEVMTTPAPAASLSLVGADTLTGVPGDLPDGGISVRVVDAFGNGVAGVTLTATATSGFVPAAIPPTDEEGYTDPYWGLGPEFGVQVLTIRGQGLDDLVIPAIVLADAPDRAIAVSRNPSHACRILPQGGAECWGNNTNGRLGAGNDQPQIGPVAVHGGHDFVAISIGGLNILDGLIQTCAVNTGGEVWCWGAAPAGSPPGIPLRVQTSVQFQFVEIGVTHTCGLDLEGGVWCWGENPFGQLGTGDRTARSQPTRVAIGAPVRDIAVGLNHTCALTRTGHILCWGSGGGGRLGTGNQEMQLLPTPVQSDLRFQTLAVGRIHSCGVAIGGGMYCWGSSLSGQVPGDGTREVAVPLPRAVRADLTFERVTGGHASTCGITTGGEGWCWGDNTAYQLADSTYAERKPAGPMEGGHTWREIALGETSGCGITTTGETRCWGFNEGGALGQEDRWRFPTPQPVAGGHLFTHIAVGMRHSCALKSDGTTWCWGSNQDSVLGHPTLAHASAPVRVAHVPEFTTLSGSPQFYCGLNVIGEVLCWGAAVVGEGPFEIKRSAVPREIALPEPATRLRQGFDLACAALQSGDVWCWETGVSGARPTAAPAQVDSPETLVTLGVACGLGATGTAYCWDRRLDASPRIPVTMLPGGPIYADVAGEGNGVCAITIGGETMCIGANGLEPLAPPPPLPLTRIEPGTLATCGLTASGAGICWGSNESGQLGRGDFVDANASLVLGGLSWIQLAPSWSHTCGLAQGGVAYCWGRGEDGELGNGVTRYFPTPVVVP